MLNIVISFVLEIYGSIEDEMDVEDRKKALARTLIGHFDQDEDGTELQAFVNQVQAEERRMVFGVAYDADEFVEEITKKDKGKERTNKGRRNSFEDIPTSKTYR